MNMVILNRSPKKNVKESNTEIFINAFQEDMKSKYPVKYIIREEHIKLIN